MAKRPAGSENGEQKIPLAKKPRTMLTVLTLKACIRRASKKINAFSRVKVALAIGFNLPRTFIAGVSSRQAATYVDKVTFPDRDQGPELP